MDTAPEEACMNRTRRAVTALSVAGIAREVATLNRMELNIRERKPERSVILMLLAFILLKI